MTYPPASYVEPAPGTPAAWRTRLGAESYTFVAVRILGAGWFVTGQISHALAWDALCFHLPPEDGRFLVLGVSGVLSACPPVTSFSAPPTQGGIPTP